MKNTLVLGLTLLVGVTPLYAAPVSVTVVDEAGEPVSKASVQFESFAKAPRGYIVAETGADGTVSFEAEPSKQSPDFLGRIVVWKQEFALGGGNLSVKKPLKIVLKKGDILRGVVLDKDKQPVKGAKISFSRIQTEDRGSSPVLYAGPLKAKMEALSDEKGAWQLGNLPAGEQIYVSIIAPGFASETPSGKTSEPIQTQLRVGASIRGKVLGLDGKPLEKLRVFAQPVDNNPGKYSYADSNTNADGTFDLQGLEAGSFNVMFQVGDTQNYVIPAFESVSVVAGDSRLLSDVRAVEGIMIGGKVTEKGTDKPVEGAQIGIYGGVNPSTSAAVSSATSDEKGVWKLRTLPGPSRVYVMGTPIGFIREDNQGMRERDISPQGDLDLNFVLERAPRIAGKLVDETGKGVVASLVVSQKYEEWPFTSDENGNFEVFGPKNGEVQFGIPRWNPGPYSNWDVVDDAKRVIPSDQPFEIKVAKAKLFKFEARVYNDDDTPVEGVKVGVYVTTGKGEGQSSRNRELISDKAGLVKIENLRSNQSITVRSVQKTGYDLSSELKVEQKDDIFRAADIIVTKRNGKIAGQVLNAKGEAVAGATLSALDIETTSDANGKFVLEPLPKGKANIMAFKDDQFALLTADGDARIELKPQALQGVDKARATQILNDLKEQTKGTNYWRKDSLNLDGIASFDEMVAKIGNAQDPSAAYRVFDQYGADLSIPLTRWIPLISTGPKPVNRLLMSVVLSNKRGKLENDETTRAWLDELQYDQAQVLKQGTPEDRWMTGMALFAVVSIADKIGNTEVADKALAEATAFISKNAEEKAERGQPSLNEVIGAMGELVGSSPRILEKLLTLVPADSSAYSQLLRDSIPQMVRSSGLDSAKPFLEKLKNAPASKPDANGNRPSIESAYWESMIKVIEAGGQSNPQLALELAQSLPRSASLGNYDARAKALSEAAFFQDKAVAESLWRESLPLLNSSLAMQYIVKIARTDEKLGRELYEITRKNLDAQPETDPNAMIYGRQRDIPAFAFYESKFNPARARYRLEKAFPNAKKDENARYNLAPYTRAMAIFDVDRALELANSLSSDQNDGFGQFEAKRGIALWLGSDEKKRENANFTGRYGQDWEF